MQVTIDASVAVVWAITQNAARRTEWDYRVIQCEQVTPGPVGKGTRCLFVGSLGVRYSMVYEYASLQHLSCCSVKFSEFKGMPFAAGGAGWTYTDLGANRCEFQTKGQFQLTKMPIAGPIDRFIFVPFLRWMTKKSLLKLKRLAEAKWRRKQDSLYAVAASR